MSEDVHLVVQPYYVSKSIIQDTKTATTDANTFDATDVNLGSWLMLFFSTRPTLAR
jgi:hypothetical protein